MTYDVKYAGYVDRQEIEIARQQRLQDKRIPAGFDFAPSASCGPRRARSSSASAPLNLAQASRISGITPADMALLMIHLGGK